MAKEEAVQRRAEGALRSRATACRLSLGVGSVGKDLEQAVIACIPSATFGDISILAGVVPGAATDLRRNGAERFNLAAGKCDNLNGELVIEFQKAIEGWRHAGIV